MAFRADAVIHVTAWGKTASCKLYVLLMLVTLIEFEWRMLRSLESNFQCIIAYNTFIQ